MFGRKCTKRGKELDKMGEGGGWAFGVNTFGDVKALSHSFVGGTVSSKFGSISFSRILSDLKGFLGCCARWESVFSFLCCTISAYRDRISLSSIFR